jgi:hypothetical protein
MIIPFTCKILSSDTFEGQWPLNTFSEPLELNHANSFGSLQQYFALGWLLKLLWPAFSLAAKKKGLKAILLF